MKKIIIFLIPLLLSNWTFFSKNKDADFYINKKSIKFNEKGLFFLGLIDKKKRSKFGESVTIYVEVDCTNRMSKTLESVFYSNSMGKGERLISESDYDWMYSPPGTLIGNMVKHSCDFFDEKTKKK